MITTDIDSSWTVNEKWLIEHIDSISTNDVNLPEGFQAPKLPKNRASVKKLVDQSLEDWKVFKTRYCKFCAHLCYFMRLI